MPGSSAREPCLFGPTGMTVKM